MSDRVTTEQARIIAKDEYGMTAFLSTNEWLGMFYHDLAADLLDARAEIATLRAKLAAVCGAASATQRAFEEQAECGDCDAKAEAMGGRVDPLCDVCMERWAVSTDALDDALAAAMVEEGWAKP